MHFLPLKFMGFSEEGQKCVPKCQNVQKLCAGRKEHPIGRGGVRG